MATIEVRNLNFIYPTAENPALRNLSFDVEESEIVVLCGKSGCGKSTLLRQLKKNLIPYGELSGSAKYRGAEISQLDDRMNSSEIGFVQQNPDNQLVATVVEEDVAFALENMGVPPEEIRKRVDDALRAVGMYEYRAQAPHRLSGGQKQRIAIAGVIAMMPRCVVLDEPTAMLDPQGRREVMNVVRELNRKFGITVILITHHMDEAVQAQRVVVMHKGNVLMDGTPREIFTQVDKLRAASLTVPQTIEVLYDLDQQDGEKLPIDALSIEECADILEQEYLN